MIHELLRFLLAFLVLAPLAACLALVPARGLSERTVARGFGLILHACNLAFAVVSGAWAVSGCHATGFDYGTLYSHGSYHFPIALMLDPASWLYLFLTLVLSNAVGKYSRHYLHRESGYRRFFTLILLMIAGSHLLAVAGTLDLLFAAWEMIGLSSFLLIGFYWQREQPVRNAFLVFCIYRICDLGMLGATLLSHLLWDDGHHFLELLRGPAAVSPELLPALTTAGALLWVAALGKSAQLPFSSWLPRALEGPTPSSAIFYGALSVHAGAFLLLRTESVWSQSTLLRAVIIATGVATALMGSLRGRTQSNIKGQIAYAAITQVGVIFVEIALGWIPLALAHLTLHSLLRAYQLLISPSVVAHSLRVIHFEGQLEPSDKAAHGRWNGFLYRLSLLDLALPARFSRLVRWPGARIAAAVALLAAFGAGGVLVAFAAWTQRRGQRIRRAWNEVAAGLAAIGAGAMVFLPRDGWAAILPYFATAAVGWMIGAWALRGFGERPLTEFHGGLARSPARAYAMLASLVCIGGLPLAPSFIGEDLLLHSIYEQAPRNAVAAAFALSLLSISVGRVFVRAFLGRPS